MFNCNFEKEITDKTDKQFHLFIDKYNSNLISNIKNKIIDNQVNHITGVRINRKNRNIYYRFAYILGYR
jgi:hypothetical protein